MNSLANRRRDLIIASMRSSILPSGYTQVDYIQTNGEPYLTLDFSDLVSNIRAMDITMTAEIVDVTNGGGIFYTKTNNYDGAEIFLNWRNIWATPVGGSSVAASKYDMFQLNIHYEETAFTAELSINDNTNVILNTSEFNRELNYFNQLNFGRGGRYTTSLPMRIKNISVNYNNGTVAGDIIPCRNDSAGEYGMYDLIHNTFVSSSGSEEFTGGNE